MVEESNFGGTYAEIRKLGSNEGGGSNIYNYPIGVQYMCSVIYLLSI